MKKFFLFFGFFFMSIGFSFSQSQLPTITLTPLAEAPKQIEFMSGNEIWFMSDGNVLVNSQNIGNPLPIDEVLVKGFVDDNEVILTSDSSVYYHPDFSGTSWANVFTANSGDRIVEILEYQGKTLVITTGGKVYQDVRTTSIIPNQIIGFAFVGTDAIGDGYYTEGAGIDNSTGELVILHTPTRAYTRNTIVSGSLISQIDIGDFNNIVVGSVSSPFYCGLTMDAVGSWGMDTRVMSFDGSGLREIVGVGGDYVELDMFGGKLLCSGSNGLNGIMLGGQILFINPPAEIFLLDVSGQVTISSFTNLFKVWGRPSCVVVHGDSIVFSLNNVWLEAPWFNNFTTGAYVTGVLYMDISPLTGTETNATNDELELTFHSLGEGGMFRVRSKNLEGINLEVRNITSFLVAQVTGNQNARVEIQNLPAGIYIAKASAGEKSVVKKFFIH